MEKVNKLWKKWNNKKNYLYDFNDLKVKRMIDFWLVDWVSELIKL